jgi:uncharacterized protein (DUF1501 family)
MLDVGSFRAASCNGVSRRAFLRAGLSVPAALGLSSAAGVIAAEPPRARSVLVVWLWGGPSHLDTFDPKPKAPQVMLLPINTEVTVTKTDGTSPFTGQSLTYGSNPQFNNSWNWNVHYRAAVSYITGSHALRAR